LLLLLLLLLLPAAVAAAAVVLPASQTTPSVHTQKCSATMRYATGTAPLVGSKHDGHTDAELV
jgi:hypothetical protein